jgi:hypothetical protein
MVWANANSGWLGKPEAMANFFRANPLTRVHLDGDVALMIDTTDELTQALDAMLAKQMQSFTIGSQSFIVL